MVNFTSTPRNFSLDLGRIVKDLFDSGSPGTRINFSSTTIPAIRVSYYYTSEVREATLNGIRKTFSDFTRINLLGIPPLAIIN